MVSKIALVLLLSGVCAASLIENCVSRNDATFPAEVCMSTQCMEAIEAQIGKELEAAFFYISKGNIYGIDVTSRPGMAKFMFEAATEERSHAIQMLDYLTLRGRSFNLSRIVTGNFEIGDYEEADILRDLKQALLKEIEVTKSILEVVDKCSEDKDFHGGDVFTNPILDEQYNGMRKLQGAIRTFENIKHQTSPDIASYLIDQKILAGEIL